MSFISSVKETAPWIGAGLAAAAGIAVIVMNPEAMAELAKTAVVAAVTYGAFRLLEFCQQRQDREVFVFAEPDSRLVQRIRGRMGRPAQHPRARDAELKRRFQADMEAARRASLEQRDIWENEEKKRGEDAGSVRVSALQSEDESGTCALGSLSDEDYRIPRGFKVVLQDRTVFDLCQLLAAMLSMEQPINPFNRQPLSDADLEMITRKLGITKNEFLEIWPQAQQFASLANEELEEQARREHAHLGAAAAADALTTGVSEKQSNLKKSHRLELFFDLLRRTTSLDTEFFRQRTSLRIQEIRRS